MRFLFIYCGGKIPQEKTKENSDQLGKWVGNLSKQARIRFGFIANGGKTVSSGTVEDYGGQVFGVSMVEPGSLEDAIKLADKWPELQYGGRMDICASCRFLAVAVTERFG